MTILKKFRNTKVVSNDGREIRIQFRLNYIAYIEHKRALYIGMTSNHGPVRTFIKIDASSGFTNWLPPYAEELLTQSKKMEILDFLEKALKLLDYSVEISNKSGN